MNLYDALEGTLVDKTKSLPYRLLKLFLLVEAWTSWEWSPVVEYTKDAIREALGLPAAQFEEAWAELEKEGFIRPGEKPGEYGLDLTPYIPHDAAYKWIKKWNEFVEKKKYRKYASIKRRINNGSWIELQNHIKELENMGYNFDEVLDAVDKQWETVKKWIFFDWLIRRENLDKVLDYSYLPAPKQENTRQATPKEEWEEEDDVPF